MKSRKLKFNDLKLKKEQMRLRVMEQELLVRSGFRDLGRSLSPANIGNQLFSGLLQNPETAVKIGYFLVSLFRARRARKRKSGKS